MRLCGLEENEPKALELSPPSAALEAQLRLAEWYKDGIVVSQDPKKAFQLYNQSMPVQMRQKLNSLFAMLMDLVSSRTKTAFSLITDAVEGGSITGQRLLVSIIHMQWHQRKHGQC